MGWVNFTQPTLQTRRDAQALEILSRAQETTSQPVLTERTSELSHLRRAYTDLLQHPDWASSLEVSHSSGMTPEGSFFSGSVGRIQTLFQFSQNWQTRSAWSFSTHHRGTSPILRQVDSSLPHLDHLELTYGPLRSAEFHLGLLSDEALLAPGQSKSIFSGLALRLHQLEQKVFLKTPSIAFTLEHGWANLLAPQQINANRIKLQRTRPRLEVSWRNNSIELSQALALEWYSDSEGILGYVAANRPFATEESRINTEKRWRLFHFRTHLKLHAFQDGSAQISFQRVSNTLGASSSPAWSVAGHLENRVPFLDASVYGWLGSALFRAPNGSIPALRLPLTLHPSSQGALYTAGLRYFPTQLKNQELFLAANASVARPLGQSTLLPCQMRASPSPQSCRLGWVNLGWSLKLPTNL